MFRCPFSPQALDGGDNGVSQYPADIAPKYKVGTALPQRVAQLNPGTMIYVSLCLTLYPSISTSVPVTSSCASMSLCFCPHLHLFVSR